MKTNIHRPTDSSLLDDAVRALCRVMQKMQSVGVPVVFRNRTKQGKRAVLAILNAKNNAVRVGRYKDFIKITKAVLGEARNPAALPDIVAEYFLTVRRIIDGKPMASSKKIVSISEAHTDIVVKDRCETYFGHKICLTTWRQTRSSTERCFWEMLRIARSHLKSSSAW